MAKKIAKKDLEKFSKEDLKIFKRFFEIIVRQYNFNEFTPKEKTGCFYDYFYISLDTIKTANLPISVIDDFVTYLSSFTDNFINIRTLHKGDYDDFQRYREYVEDGIRITGEDSGYSVDSKEMKNEITNYFNGFFIRDVNKKFIKTINKITKDIEDIINETEIINEKSEDKIKIYIDNYFIYRFLRNKKLETEIKDTSRKLLLDYLLDNNRRILSDELAKHILTELKLSKERKPTSQKISNDIKDINKNFRLQLKFPTTKKDIKHRLILPSNRKGYYINHETFDIEREN